MSANEAKWLEIEVPSLQIKFPVNISEIYYVDLLDFGLFLQVNGDIIEWVQEKNKDMTPVWKEAASVGFNISTKSVGSSDRLDVTHLYKHPEGSAKEREIVKSIAKFR